jgi:NAD(P)-dependent dehydrogenase (short-subunit alcohol dehydrogenase family)
VRVAVVTGGSSGIGEAVARRLRSAGWACVLVARGRERLEEAAERLGAEAESCDVGDRDQVDELARRVAERHPAIHLLVNNAGMPAGGGYLDVPPERVDEVTRVNYLGSVWCALAFLPLLERGVPSDIVNVASVAGTVTALTSGPYAASKHAQLAFSRGLARELAPTGIRVHAVNPGPVPTASFPQQQALSGRFSRRFVVTVDDVARSILGAVEKNRREVFVPNVFRVASALEAVFPGTLTRITAARRWRR